MGPPTDQKVRIRIPAGVLLTIDVSDFGAAGELLWMVDRLSVPASVSRRLSTYLIMMVMVRMGEFRLFERHGVAISSDSHTCLGFRRQT